MSDGEKLRLHYFNGRGRAELSRYILKFAGREFEDIRYTKEDWPNHKPKFPGGQLPVLEIVKDGKSRYLIQSMAIARWLARKNKLAGADDLEAAHCDEVVDCISDVILMVVRRMHETDENEKEKLKTKLNTEEYPRVLCFLEKKLQENGGKHMVGKGWTWADFAVFMFMSGLMENPGENGNVCEKAPGLCALTKSVGDIPAIAKWIKERPNTSM